MHFKYLLLFCLFLGTAFVLKAQKEDEILVQEILEKLVENAEAEGDYLDLYDQVAYYLQHPININNADMKQLMAVPFVGENIANAILEHRQKNGPFLSLYELQLLENTDAKTLWVITHFFSLDAVWQQDQTSLAKMLKSGRGDWISLYSQTLQKSRGYIIADSISPGNEQAHYAGASFRLASRFQYKYTNKLSLGFSAEKDAGEEFFKGSNKQGFDFYSAHFFLRDHKKIKALALGDYQVGFGQGLTISTGLGFGKSAFVSNVKRNYGGLRQYRALNENEFLRGAGITLALGEFDVSVFASANKVDASLLGEDTGAFSASGFSSFQTSGLHRTGTEIANKKSLSRKICGVNADWNRRNFQIGITAVGFAFDKPLNPNYKPYNRFYLAGEQTGTLGLHYSYIRANANFFGEMAKNLNGGFAMLHGLLLGLGQKADLSLLYRNYGRSYQTQFSNAFGETSNNNNEQGFYAGLSIRPKSKWVLNSYFDMFHRPWLAYQTDAPSRGNDFMLEAQYNYSRKIHFYVRYRTETKQRNASENTTVTNYLADNRRQSLRFHATYGGLLEWVTFRSRIEFSRYQSGDKEAKTGTLLYQDVLYKPLQSRFSFIFRYALFNVDDYYARLYAYENDVLYSFSVPAFQDKGSRYYLIVKCKLARNTELWLRFAQTSYFNKTSISSGLDTIYGNRRSELKVQVRMRF